MPSIVDRFTDASKLAFYMGMREAQAEGASELTPEHLLGGLLRESGGAAIRLLSYVGADPNVVLTAVGPFHDLVGPLEPEKLKLADATEQVIGSAIDEAALVQSETIHPWHLLAALASSQNSTSAVALSEAGATLDRIRSGILALYPDEVHGGETVWPPPVVGPSTRTPLSSIIAGEMSLAERLKAIRIALVIGLVFSAFTAGDIFWNLITHWTGQFGKWYTPNPGTVWPPALLGLFGFFQSIAAMRQDPHHTSGRMEMVASALLTITSIGGIVVCVMTILSS